MIRENKINNFSKWLAANGAEIIPTTNEFERLRFNCAFGVGVVYKGRKGITPNLPFVNDAYKCFIGQKQWSGKGERISSKTCPSEKANLLRRDGNECFYCGVQFKRKDLTVEHLLSGLFGGSNRLENKVLACQPCNLEAGHKAVIDKIKLRDEKRS